MSETHVSAMLARFAAELRFEDLPAETVEHTRIYLADWFAASFAGEKVNGAYNRAVREILFDMGGKEEASVMFSDRRLPVMHAAFLLAAYAHGADMDDGNRKAMGHVGAHVMSAALALSETLPDVTGRDLVTAINVGYEVYNRVAAAAQPGLVRRGFHSTGTAGAIACAAVAAKLMRLDEAGIYAAMSAAAVQASGLIIIAESGQALKPVNPANAARTGIFSAKLAAARVDCPRYPLESDKGWLHAMTDAPDLSMITDGLGKTFTIDESYLKPYPSCRHTHPGIECALRLRARMAEKYGEFRAGDVSAVEVYIYENAIRIAGQIRIPATDDDSKFSVHYSLATALVRGHFDLSDLAVSGITDEIRKTVDKIRLLPDASMEQRDAGIRGCRTVLVTKDGERLEETVLIPKGDAANPFTWEDIRQKLAGCADGLLSASGQEKLIAAVRGIDRAERFPDVRILTRD